jgi:murein DD-endopeptidase MepM/ murein hydrolase activator NlpD
MQTIYGHLAKVNVRIGQKVKRGDVIAFVGNTGLSTGPHVHYEIFVNNVPVNPLRYILN